MEAEGVNLMLKHMPLEVVLVSLLQSSDRDRFARVQPMSLSISETSIQHGIPRAEKRLGRQCGRRPSTWTYGWGDDRVSA